MDNDLAMKLVIVLTATNGTKIKIVTIEKLLIERAGVRSQLDGINLGRLIGLKVAYCLHTSK